MLLALQGSHLDAILNTTATKHVIWRLTPWFARTATMTSLTRVWRTLDVLRIELVLKEYKVGVFVSFFKGYDLRHS